MAYSTPNATRNPEPQMLYAAFDSQVVSFDTKAERAEWLTIFSHGFKPVTAAEARKLATPEQRRRADAGYCLASQHYQKKNGVWQQCIARAA
jgi:hypothetical protein